MERFGGMTVTAIPPGRSVGLVTLATDAELAFFRELVAGDDKVEVRLLAPPRPNDDDGDEAAAQLASDRLRHAGVKARVFLEGNDPAAIRRRLKQGIRARLEHGSCVD